MNNQRVFLPHLALRVLEYADTPREPIGETGAGSRGFPSSTIKCTYDKSEDSCQDIVGETADEQPDRVQELHRFDISEGYRCDDMLPEAKDVVLFGASEHRTEN